MSFPPGTEMFQFPGFASVTYGFSDGYPIAEVGCPIRRSSDQSLLAAPQGFSQRATSFIASWRQGIHQMPLLSSTHPSDNRTRAPARPKANRQHRAHGRHGPGPGNNHALPTTALTRTGQDGRHTHAKNVRAPQTENQNGHERHLPAPVQRTRAKTSPGAPGRAHITTSRCPKNSPPPPPAQGRPRRAGQRGSLPGAAEAGPATTPAGPSKNRRTGWWAWADLNGRPHAYQACALTS